MQCLFLLPVLAGLGSSADIHGQYVEARTCDVFAGSCFANADTGITGKNAVLAWKIETGKFAGTKIDGLGVAAVISSSETLGLKQSAPARAVLIVDERASKDQCEALVKFAKSQAGNLLTDVKAVHTVPFDLTICNCEGEGCATLTAGKVKIVTRCINLDHDRACGNETTLYSPLSKGIKAKPALTTEHSYTGNDLNETWHDAGRRGAYVGSFATR